MPCKTGWAHIIIRGINRENLFYDEEDFLHFQETFTRYQKKCGLEYAAVCLMSNHAHLLLWEQSGCFSEFMKKLTVSYAQYYNKKFERVGPVFQDRYRCESIDDERYLLTVARYIYQNPQKAGICPSAKYPYTLLNKTGVLSGYFSCENDLMDYLTQKNEDCCMEYEVSRKFSDAEVTALLAQLTGSSNPQFLQNAERNDRDRILNALKKKGISIRTISRLTGINRNVVQRAGTLGTVGLMQENPEGCRYDFVMDSLTGILQRDNTLIK